MSDMGKEELLDGMEKMLNYYGREEWYYKDLINQLVKIVEEYFSGVPPLCNFCSLWKIAHTEQSGGVVTEANELVGGWLYRIWEHADTRLSFEEFIDVTKTILQQPQKEVKE